MLLNVCYSDLHNFTLIDISSFTNESQQYSIFGVAWLEISMQM